jgi:hypothetical protein
MWSDGKGVMNYSTQQGCNLLCKHHALLQVAS